MAVSEAAVRTFPQMVAVDCDGAGASLEFRHRVAIQGGYCGPYSGYHRASGRPCSSSSSHWLGEPGDQVGCRRDRQLAAHVGVCMGPVVCEKNEANIEAARPEHAPEHAPKPEPEHADLIKTQRAAQVRTTFVPWAPLLCLSSLFFFGGGLRSFPLTYALSLFSLSAL